MNNFETNRDIGTKRYRYIYSAPWYMLYNIFINDMSIFKTSWEKVNHLKFLKGCLPQILLGPFLNNSSHF